MPGSNRTIVGLKQVLAWHNGSRAHEQQSHHCGIETGNLVGWVWTLDAQQSHHCGIETLVWVVSLETYVRQQSHHCGIETYIGRGLDLREGEGSNRTIVGLKLTSGGVLTCVKAKQQSHHCGIETWCDCF